MHVAIIAMTSDVFASAWLLPYGKSQIINTLYFETSTKFFDDTGSSLSSKKFTKMEYDIYAEHGYYDNLTLGINTRLDYFRQNILEDVLDGTEINAGLGNTEIFLRTSLWKDDNSIFSIQPSIRFPGFETQTKSTLIISEKQIDFEIRGLYGYNFAYFNNNNFINIELAYQRKIKKLGDEYNFDVSSHLGSLSYIGNTGGVDQEVNFDITLGIKPPNYDIMLLTQLYAVFSDRKADVVDVVFTSGEREHYTGYTDSHSLKIQFSVAKELSDKFSIQLGAFKTVLGKNAGEGSGALLSLWIKF